MRDAAPTFRSRMWGTGAVDGTWHCGMCLLRSLEEEQIFTRSPPEAIAYVKSRQLTVPDDAGAVSAEDPIDRSVLAAPSDM